MAYTRVSWQDYPNTNTPLNATNLNKMDAGIADIDGRVTDLEEAAVETNTTTLEGVSWKWTKFSNGLVILTGSVTYNQTLSAWGNAWQTDTHNYTYPITFSAVPHFYLTLESAYALAPATIVNSNSTSTSRTPGFFGWRGASASGTVSVTWKMLVVGYVQV